MPLTAPITSRSNTRVKALRASFSGHATRPGNLLGLEGEHLIAEAQRSGLPLETVFLREGGEAVLERPMLAGLRGGEIVVLSGDVFDSAVETASPQGVAAMVRLPEAMAVDLSVKPGLVLVVESLQDPGNLGTLLRSAEAFGVVQVFTTPDTVSPWNPKAVRASAGSVFRMPVMRLPLAAVKERLVAAGIGLYAAVAHGEQVVTPASLRVPCAVMVGNEGAGLSMEALALADLRVHIPCEVESLNASVAASILLFAARVGGD